LSADAWPIIQPQLSRNPAASVAPAAVKDRGRVITMSLLETIASFDGGHGISV
jgi:hypothetical protein